MKNVVLNLSVDENTAAPSVIKSFRVTHDLVLSEVEMISIDDSFGYGGIKLMIGEDYGAVPDPQYGDQYFTGISGTRLKFREDLFIMKGTWIRVIGLNTDTLPKRFILKLEFKPYVPPEETSS